MSYTTTATTGSAQISFTLSDIKKAADILRGIPPSKWMLVAPDGRMWSDADPLKLIYVLGAAKYGIEVEPPAHKGAA